MKKYTQQEIDSLMTLASIYTDNEDSKTRLAINIALRLRSEAYKGGGLESSRIEHWEDVMDELLKANQQYDER